MPAGLASDELEGEDELEDEDEDDPDVCGGFVVVVELFIGPPASGDADGPAFALDVLPALDVKMMPA